MTDAPTLSDFLCFDTYRANLAFGRFYAGVLAPHGLTYPQYLVLVTLLAEDGQTVTAIAGKLGLVSSTLTPLLKRLQAAGYIARSRDSEDERRVRIHLTPAGEALRAPLARVPACVAEAAGLTRAEMQTAQKLMRRLATALEDGTPEASRRSG